MWQFFDKKVVIWYQTYLSPSRPFHPNLPEFLDGRSQCRSDARGLDLVSKHLSKVQMGEIIFSLKIILIILNFHTLAQYFRVPILIFWILSASLLVGSPVFLSKDLARFLDAKHLYIQPFFFSLIHILTYWLTNVTLRISRRDSIDHPGMYFCEHFRTWDESQLTAMFQVGNS